MYSSSMKWHVQGASGGGSSLQAVHSQAKPSQAENPSDQAMAQASLARSHHYRYPVNCHLCTEIRKRRTILHNIKCKKYVCHLSWKFSGNSLTVLKQLSGSHLGVSTLVKFVIWQLSVSFQAVFRQPSHFNFFKLCSRPPEYHSAYSFFLQVSQQEKLLFPLLQYFLTPALIVWGKKS